MTCSNDSSLCVWNDTITFCRPLENHAQHVSESVFCQTQKVSGPPLCWASSSLVAMYCTDGFYQQSQETNGCNPVLSHSCKDCQLLPIKNDAVVAESLTILTLYSHYSPAPLRPIQCVCGAQCHHSSYCVLIHSDHHGSHSV